MDKSPRSHPPRPSVEKISYRSRADGLTVPRAVLRTAAIQTGELSRAMHAWDAFVRLTPGGESRQLVSQALAPKSRLFRKIQQLIRLVRASV